MKLKSIRLFILVAIILYMVTYSYAELQEDTMHKKGMQLEEYLNLKSINKPYKTFYYGVSPSQFANLYLPKAEGKIPLVVVIHGGCWNKEYKGIQQIGAIAEKISNTGVAVWSVEYRRVNENGGGFPGTYFDVIEAMKKLESIADDYNIDTKNIVIIGHSAGGHLALWYDAKANINKRSKLYKQDDSKLNISKVIALGSISDLRNAYEACDDLEGNGGLDTLADPYYEGKISYFENISPIDMLPTNTPIVMINGTEDVISPPYTAINYQNKAKEYGLNIKVHIVEGATHYDEVSPYSSIFGIITDELNKSFK